MRTRRHGTPSAPSTPSGPRTSSAPSAPGGPRTPSGPGGPRTHPPTSDFSRHTKQETRAQTWSGLRRGAAGDRGGGARVQAAQRVGRAPARPGRGCRRRHAWREGRRGPGGGVAQSGAGAARERHVSSTRAHLMPLGRPPNAVSVSSQAQLNKSRARLPLNAFFFGCRPTPTSCP